MIFKSTSVRADVGHAGGYQIVLPKSPRTVCRGGAHISGPTESIPFQPPRGHWQTFSPSGSQHTAEVQKQTIFSTFLKREVFPPSYPFLAGETEALAVISVAVWAWKAGAVCAGL